MSGGRFNYMNDTVQNEIFGYWDEGKIPNVFEDREISELIYDVFNLIHDFDWYASGDTCKETYLKQKAAFKKKWLQNRGSYAITIYKTAVVAEQGKNRKIGMSLFPTRIDMATT